MVVSTRSNLEVKSLPGLSERDTILSLRQNQLSVSFSAGRDQGGAVGESEGLTRWVKRLLEEPDRILDAGEDVDSGKVDTPVIRADTA